MNAGIGGTDSLFGAARLERDLLREQPDFVIVDFSVNDKAKECFQETFEGVLRKLLSWPSEPAVLVLNNVYYDTGENAQDLHNQAAARYGISWVSIRDTVYERMLEGKYRREDLTPDGLHPSDFGHRLVADEVIRYLEKVNEEALSRQDFPEGERERERAAKLPEPMTRNAYEQAVCLDCLNSFPEASGFAADARGHLDFLVKEGKAQEDFFRNGWIGKERGDWIAFAITSSCLAIQYRKSVKGDACIARLTIEGIDGNEEISVILDGNFEESWGDCLYMERIFEHKERRLRRVRVEVIKKGKVPFYLLSFIAA